MQLKNCLNNAKQDEKLGSNVIAKNLVQPGKGMRTKERKQLLERSRDETGDDDSGI